MTTLEELHQQLASVQHALNFAFQTQEDLSGTKLTEILGSLAHAVSILLMQVNSIERELVQIKEPLR